jgi:hypothetical protein
MVGHQWYRPMCGAWARSRDRPCMRRVVMRPDGSLASRCANHGGLTPPYWERLITKEGRAKIGAATKARWEAWRRDKALGLPVIAMGRPKRPKRVYTPPDPAVEAAERRQRAIAELKRCIPGWQEP